MIDNEISCKNVMQASASAFVMFLLMTVSFVFIAYRIDAEWWPVAVGGALTLSIAYLYWVDICYRERGGGGQLEWTKCLCVIMPFFVLLAIVVSSGWVLPAHDPIAVPLLAKTIASGFLPLDHFPSGSSAYSYPPGYPIIFAPAMALLDPLNALFLFKLLNILTVCLIPASWAWMHSKLFPLNAPLWQLTLCFYLGFFGIERTIGFALPFAGKNAVLFGILVLPIVVVTAVRLAKTWRGLMLSIPAIIGLVLIHFTMLHLLAAMLGGYALLALARREIEWVEFLRIGLMGLLPALFILGFFHEAVVDPRAGDFQFSPMVGLSEMLSVMLDRKSFVVIYMDTDFGIAGFPFRGLALAVCALISIGVSLIAKNPVFRRGGVFYFTAFVIALALSVGVVPSGLARDFGRWFMWAIQASMFSQALIALVWLAKISAGYKKAITYSVVLVVCLAAVKFIVSDSVVFKRVNDQQQVQKHQLHEMQLLLKKAAANASCFLISDSVAREELLITLQPEKTWEYAEIVSHCQFVNGSWVQPGLVGGRDLGGFPSASVFRELIDSGTVLFLGGEQRLSNYSGRLNGLGIPSRWERIGGTDGFPVWKYVGGS